MFTVLTSAAIFCLSLRFTMHSLVVFVTVTDSILSRFMHPSTVTRSRYHFLRLSCVFRALFSSDVRSLRILSLVLAHICAHVCAHSVRLAHVSAHSCFERSFCTSSYIIVPSSLLVILVILTNTFLSGYAHTFPQWSPAHQVRAYIGSLCVEDVLIQYRLAYCLFHLNICSSFFHSFLSSFVD